MGRAIDQLQIAAALRHAHPDALDADPLTAALAPELKSAARAPAAVRAWLGIRDRWFDRIIRLRIMPGHAQIALVGAGLDPGPGRLPPGLLGEGRLWLIDRPEVLALRTERLEAAALSEPAQAIHCPADPLDPKAVADALRAADIARHLPLTVLWIGAAPLGDLSALDALAAALFALPIPTVQLVFDWFGPDLGRLPETVQSALIPWGAPMPLAPLGMELALGGHGATHVKTTPLLSHADIQAGFGTEAERIS